MLLCQKRIVRFGLLLLAAHRVWNSDVGSSSGREVHRHIDLGNEEEIHNTSHASVSLVCSKVEEECLLLAAVFQSWKRR